MDQRSLIENHTALIAEGWQIQMEMTDRSQSGKVMRYLLSNFELGNSEIEVVLTYPEASKTGKYELVSKNELGVISSEVYRFETDAQYALLAACKYQTDRNNDTAITTIACCRTNFSAALRNLPLMRSVMRLLASK